MITKDRVQQVLDDYDRYYDERTDRLQSSTSDSVDDEWLRQLIEFEDTGGVALRIPKRRLEHRRKIEQADEPGDWTEVDVAEKSADPNRTKKPRTIADLDSPRPNPEPTILTHSYRREVDVAALTKADIALSVKGIIRNAEREILILDDSYGPWWDLPGGHVSDGETLDHAIAREILEETGLVVTSVQELFARQLHYGGKDRVVIFYNVGCYGEIVLSEEHKGYQWISYDSIDSVDMGVFRQILDTLEIINKADPKMGKHEAKYESAKEVSREVLAAGNICGECKHFRIDTDDVFNVCDLVTGFVEFYATCKLFEEGRGDSFFEKEGEMAGDGGLGGSVGSTEVSTPTFGHGRPEDDESIWDREERGFGVRKGHVMTLAHTTLTINNKVFTFEVAKDYKRGLGLRDYLEPGHGMLFYLNPNQATLFTMHDMRFSIDLISIDVENRVNNIIRNAQPDSEREVKMTIPACKAVLEVNAGEATGIFLEDDVRWS